MNQEQARRVADAVVGELRGRKGFDWWWETIEPEIQKEILAELVTKVQEVAR